MDTSSLNWNIPHFKSHIEEQPTHQNGWSLEYEGPIHKKSQESIMRVYKKMESGESAVTMKIEAKMKGLKAENLFLMMKDLSYRAKMEHAPKQIKLVEQISRNSDIIYVEIDLPFPLSNRDLVQQRLYIGNKEDPELIRKLGLYNCPHRYYVLLTQSVVRPDIPEKKKPIRAETKMNYVIIEEDPNDPSAAIMKVVTCQKLNGGVPDVLVNKVATKIPHKLMEAIINSYSKFFH